MTALILVDVQNDFFPGGALAIKDGDKIIPVINQLLTLPFETIIATQDWHPSDHGSFASVHGKQPGEHVTIQGVDQILWPTHCVQGTHGADFAPGWDVQRLQKIIHKGVDKNVDSYSTFFDNEHRRATGLNDYLKEKMIKDVYIAGVATDYCVKFSVLDALELGYNVYVIADACKGVNLIAEDSKKALDDMRYAGAHIIESQHVLM